ncbi:MAG: glycosyltransferase family 2 protein [Candidatus Binatia bacterium]
MTLRVSRDVSARDPRADDTEILAALLRREQQIDAIEGSLGWRLLSYYGPYKYRFVRPWWWRLRGLLQQWRGNAGADVRTPYEAWARFADRFRDATLPALPPTGVTVSIVMTVDIGTRPDLDAAVSSILAQSHPEWELHVATVGAASILEDHARGRWWHSDDARITIDPESHPSHAAATNAALNAVRGGIVAFCPATAELAVDALRVAVETFAASDGDVLYSDEDLRDDAGWRQSPELKPGWSPDLLLSWMYWSRLVFYRRDLLSRLLPLQSELEGAHLYDLALRATEGETRIVHVPRILAHVHAPPATAGTLTTKERDAGLRALAAALVRRNISGRVEWHADGQVYRVRRTPATAKKVSIIIPTRDGLAMLRRCLQAVEATDYPLFEVVIVDNGSVERSTLAFLATTPHKVVRAPGPFNFSRLNNVAVGETDGAYVLFLNNDTEPCDTGWLSALVEHAERPEVGAVGAKLLYADGRIQHAGIALGVGGLAGHPYRFQREAPESIRNVSAVTAACLLMRREAFDTIGGFDERLPVNSNDVDLCLRLRERGYLVVYTPHAILHHYESQTRGFRAAPDDAWLMTHRWRDVLQADPYSNPNVDHGDEAAVVDMTKPDGMVCLYAGGRRADGLVQVEDGGSVGQCFYATGANLCAVVVRAAGPGPYDPDGFRLSIRESAASGVAVRTISRHIGGRTSDELWFCFEPIAESADRFWYFVIESREGHELSLRRTPLVSDVMGPCLVNQSPSHGTLVFQLYGRASYRCVTSPP